MNIRLESGGGLGAAARFAALAAAGRLLAGCLMQTGRSASNITETAILPVAAAAHGELTAGTRAAMGAAGRSAMKKMNSAALPVRAGLTYFLELEPLPREAAAEYRLGPPDLAEAEQRIAPCTLGKAAAAKAPPGPANT